MQFTISARSKMAGQAIQQFIRRNFGQIPVEQIDSFFGFTTYTSLYGGRIWNSTELSEYDIRSMYKMNINLRLPLTNHEVSIEEYKENIPFLEKYDRPGNSIIVTNDDLARRQANQEAQIRANRHLIDTVIDNDGTLADLERTVRAKNERLIPVLASALPLFNANGELQLVVLSHLLALKLCRPLFILIL